MKVKRARFYFSQKKTPIVLAFLQEGPLAQQRRTLDCLLRVFKVCPHNSAFIFIFYSVFHHNVHVKSQHLCTLWLLAPFLASPICHSAAHMSSHLFHFCDS